MKRARLLALAIMAMFILGAVAAAAASAESVEILPVPTEAAPLKFESKQLGTKGLLEGEVAGSAIECSGGTSKGEFTSANLGLGSITFTGCKSQLNGAKCESLGLGVAGSIVVKVDWHLVDVLLPAGHPLPALMLGIAAILLVLLHVTCGAALLILVGVAINSGVLGEFFKVAESGVKTKTGELNFVQSKGVQEVKECDFDKKFCEGRTFGLYIELGKGREKGGEESANEVTFEKEAAFDY
jgi:hypothetical protein